MDIGKEKERITVEPLESPVPSRTPAPEPERIETPAPEREPVPVGVPDE